MRYRWMIAILALTLTGCAGVPEAQMPPLPTATPEPTAIIPTSTATFLPPPTVTPFSTATPRAAIALSPAPTDGAATLAATATPTEVVRPTVGVPTLVPRSPTPSPAATEMGSVPAGVALGRLDFRADFYQGWPSVNTTTTHIRLSGGLYVFEVGPLDAGFVTTNVVDIGDFYASIEATPSECPENSGYGLLFHFVDNNNYYALNVWCNGTYSVVKRVDGLLRTGMASGSLSEELDPTTPISHQIAVLGVGDQYTIYFDGQTLETFEDNSHGEGDIAIYAISQGVGVIQVSFDNLEVWAVR